MSHLSKTDLEELDELFDNELIYTFGPIGLRTQNPESPLVAKLSGEFRPRHYRRPRWWQLIRRWRERHLERQIEEQTAAHW